MAAEDDDVIAFARRDDLPDERSPKPVKKRGARRLTRRDALESLRRIAALPRYPTPFTTLNDAVGLGGHIGGQVMILAGGTGIGKTTMLLAFANHFAVHHGAVLFVSIEMESGHCLARGAAPHLGVRSNQLLTGEVTIPDEESTGVSDRIEWVERCTLVELRESVEDMTRENGGRAPLVIIDYLQKLAVQQLPTMERPDLRLATSATSSTLIAIARDFHAPLLVVSSASRFSSQKIKGNTGGKIRDPRDFPPSDLVDVSKESSDVEYDAANVLALNVSDEKDVDGYQMATLTVAKARYGRSQHINMAFDGAGAAWFDRGRYEKRKKDEEAEYAQMSAARIAELNALQLRIVNALSIEPLSSEGLRTLLHKKRDDITAALRPLLRTGRVVERGRGSRFRFHLAEQAPELPGIGVAQ